MRSTQKLHLAKSLYAWGPRLLLLIRKDFDLIIRYIVVTSISSELLFAHLREERHQASREAPEKKRMINILFRIRIYSLSFFVVVLLVDTDNFYFFVLLFHQIDLED